jgi:hypothetical protein
MQFHSRNIPSTAGQASTSGRINVPRATFCTRQHLRHKSVQDVDIYIRKHKSVRPHIIASAAEVDDAIESTSNPSKQTLNIDRSDEVIEEGAPDLPKVEFSYRMAALILSSNVLF